MKEYLTTDLVHFCCSFVHKYAHFGIFKFQIPVRSKLFKQMSLLNLARGYTRTRIFFKIPFITRLELSDLLFFVNFQEKTCTSLHGKMEALKKFPRTSLCQNCRWAKLIDVKMRRVFFYSIWYRNLIIYTFIILFFIRC